MGSESLDILAVGVHPDDVELSCSGTLMQAIDQGKRCGVMHLTRGEMGTRGTADLRMKESKAAAEKMGVHALIQLDLKDCRIHNDEESRMKIIEVIRTYKPGIVLCNAVNDRHPDHGHAAALVADACFYSGLEKIKTRLAPHRPQQIFHYAQDRLILADLVIDITPYMKKKLEVIQCYASQFYDPNSQEPETSISRKDFLAQVEGKCRAYGREIGVEFGEAYSAARPIGVRDLSHLY